MVRQLFFSLSILALAACTGNLPVATPAPTPMVFQPMLGRGLSFLARQFDAEPGLLHASPAAPGVYWLAPDNLLAAWVFQEANAKELAAKLATTLDQHDIQGNGLIETIAGAEVAWPPAVAAAQELAAGVWQQSRNGAVSAEEWAASAELTLFAALNAWNSEDPAAAHSLYADALGHFDGTGFRDEGFAAEYSTRPLALAVIAGQRIGATVDPAIVARLRALQSTDGGFVAHYTADGPIGAADSETTGYALLAFYALRQPLMFVER